VEDLAVEVGHIDAIMIDDPDRPNSGGDKIQRRGGTEPAGADDEHPRRQQALLAP